MGVRAAEKGVDRILAALVLAAFALIGSAVAAGLLNRSKMVGPVRYMYDDESKNWAFEVPSLGIMGGAETRAAAEQQAGEAIAYTLRFQEKGKAASA